MLDLRNHTPLTTGMVPALDQSGCSYAVVIIKGEFDIRHRSLLRLSDAQQPVLLADEYHGEPGKSSIKYEADTSRKKQATDIILNGHAYTPHNRPASSVDVSLQFGNRSKSRRVFGDRFWEKSLIGWQASPPVRFTKMPLRYEYAYGGVDESREEQGGPTFLATNPVGKGFIGPKCKPSEGLPLPNIEDPAALIQDWEQRPVPVGFGSIARNWQPRLGLAGTYDEQWQKKRLPLLPLDFDDRYFNSAHPDFIAQTALPADESFHLTNLTESGELTFQLPAIRLAVLVSIKGRTQSYRPTLDTLVIEPDEQRVLLTWRATVPCSRQFLYIDSITVKGKV